MLGVMRSQRRFEYWQLDTSKNLGGGYRRPSPL